MGEYRGGAAVLARLRATYGGGARWSVCELTKRLFPLRRRTLACRTQDDKTFREWCGAFVVTGCSYSRLTDRVLHVKNTKFGALKKLFMKHFFIFFIYYIEISVFFCQTWRAHI
jgi:hypothetical protein